MASIWEALPHFLISDTALEDLVEDKIYPMRLPQTTTLPAITYQDISTISTQAHGERSALPRKRFQFTIYGGTISSVDAIAKALKDRLDGYRGDMGEDDFLTEVDACLFKNEISDDDTETGIMKRLQDYVIQYKE
jgi:hypothetical protein